MVLTESSSACLDLDILHSLQVIQEHPVTRILLSIPCQRHQCPWDRRKDPSPLRPIPEVEKNLRKMQSWHVDQPEWLAAPGLSPSPFTVRLLEHSYCNPILSTPCFNFPNKSRTPSRIPSAWTPNSSPLVRYTPVLAPPRLTFTPPRLRFKAGAMDADSGGGSYTDAGNNVAAERHISR